MCLQLALQMHTELQQPQPDWRWQNLPVLQSSLLPCPLLNKSAARVELLMFCIHLFFIQSDHVFWSISFSDVCLLFLPVFSYNPQHEQNLASCYYKCIISSLPLYAALPSFSQKLRKTIFLNTHFIIKLFFHSCTPLKTNSHSSWR